MKRPRSSATFKPSVALILLAALATLAPLGAQNGAKRAFDLEDILAYRGIGITSLSPNGQWIAYRMSPLQGDSEVIVRSTTGDKEMKFGVGEGQGGAALFSADSGWMALTTSLTRKEAEAARRARRPVQNSVTIVNLATGEKVNIPKIRRFEFAGEAAGWIALHRYGPETPGAGGRGAAAAPAGGRGGGPAPDAPRDTRPRGTDLILRNLKDGTEINVGNVSEFAFNKSGRYLALIIDAADQAGNGIQIRDMSAGSVTSLETDKAFYERLTWTREGDAIAALKGKDDRQWRERLFSVVGFTGADKGTFKKTAYDPAQDKSFPQGMSISGSRAPQWTDDREAIMFGIAKLTKAQTPQRGRGAGEGEATEAQEGAGGRGAGPAQNEETNEERPSLVIWHFKDPRLQSQQRVQENADRNQNYLTLVRVGDNKLVRLADEEAPVVTFSGRGRWAIGINDDPYELMGNLDGRRFQDIYGVDVQTGQKKVVKKQLRWPNAQSPDGSKYLYYENQHYHVFDMSTGETRNITMGVPSKFVNVEDDHNIVDPPTPVVGWSADSASVLISDRWDVWRVPVAAGAPAVNLTVNGRKDAIRYGNRIRTDPEERGIDLTKPQYFSAMSEWTKRAGYGVLQPGKPGLKMLLWEDAAISRLAKAEKADVWIYSKETPTAATAIFVTDSSLSSGRKVIDTAKESEAFHWSSGAMLIDYKNAKGERLQGSLYLPANYEKGKQYPTIVYIYERLTQGHYQYGRPSANGFSRQAYTSNGYAVLQPDIKYYVNDPGMSAVWALVPAVQAAIATGVVDPKRVGLHGHSWGGYQTAFTITQTDIFAAAIAGAPLTNMISMYSIIYKNTGGTNGAIFESSQGRFTAGPWDQWVAYTRNSPVAHAKNVKTPLLMLHNDLDGAVDFTQGIEYFNTLRRLGKPVVLLEYPGENHGLARPANQQDYTVRMKEFFNHHLKGADAPEWLKYGIPRLKMQEHIDQRLKERQEKKNVTPPGGQRGGGGGQ